MEGVKMDGHERTLKCPFRHFHCSPTRKEHVLIG
jgi:hypothetical protein